MRIKRFFVRKIRNPFLILFIVIVFIFFLQGNNINFYKLVLLLMGMFMTMNGIINFMKTRRNTQNSTIINEVVVELIKESDNDGYYSYYPLIEYYDEISKAKYVYKSRNGYWHSKFKIGQDVELLSCRIEGETVLHINTKFDTWGYSVLSFLFGVASLLAGFVDFIMY